MRGLFTSLAVSLVLVALLAGLFVPSGAKANDTVLWLQNSNLVVAARKALKNGDVARSIRLTRKAMKQKLTFSDLFSAYNNLCVAYSDLRLFDISLDYCERALKLKTDWQLLNNRANAKLGLGKLDEAIADYRAALELKPDADVLKDNLELALQRKRLGITTAPRRQDGV